MVEGHPGDDRFEEASHASLTPVRPSRGAWIVAVLSSALASLGVAISARPPLWAASLIGAGAAALSIALMWRFSRRSAPNVPVRAIVLRGRSLAYDLGDGALPQSMLMLDASFGLTLLSNRSRTRATMVITAGDGTFYVVASVEQSERVTIQRVLASAYTVASDERALDAAAPDGSSFHLSARSFARLHDALVRLDPSAASRICLSDARGEAVTLEGQRLAVGRRSFDLTVPLEWHGMLFRESGFGGSVAVYQGTHVRQGSTEVVFVSLMPALSAPTALGDMIATTEPLLERAVLRDMSLMHEAAEEPPPQELRVAVERVFMLPLRAALAGARQRMSSHPDHGDSGRVSRPLRLS